MFPFAKLEKDSALTFKVSQIQGVDKARLGNIINEPKVMVLERPLQLAKRDNVQNAMLAEFFSAVALQKEMTGG